MLRKFLLSVALTVCVSAPGLADINQVQNWGIGVGSAINLVGGCQTASNINSLTVSLDQMQTQPAGLSALQRNIPSGQPIQLVTTGMAFGGQILTVDFLHNNALNGGAISLVTSLPLYTTVQ
jgi:hypothetical protein